jgi:hypothetical protein
MCAKSLTPTGIGMKVMLKKVVKRWVVEVGIGLIWQGWIFVMVLKNLQVERLHKEREFLV